MQIMIVISHIQHCVERYRSRKALAWLSAHQMSDIGMTHNQKITEMSQASLLGFARDLRKLLERAAGDT